MPIDINKKPRNPFCKWYHNDINAGIPEQQQENLALSSPRKWSNQVLQ
jgi:hypothetical protein